MTINEAQKKVDDWIQEYGVRYFDELTNTLVLQEEMGELSRLMSRVYGEQSFKKATTKEEAKSAIKDEMADILFVLICLANQQEIDLQDALNQNLLKKTNRDKDRHKQNEKLRKG